MASNIFSALLYKHLNPNLQCGMIYFHRILKSHDEFFSHDLTLREFEKLLDSLMVYFDIKTPDDWLAGNLSNKKPSIMISFDDGYADNMEAAKILEARGARGTFFVSTAGVASGGAPQSLWQNKVLAHYKYQYNNSPPADHQRILLECRNVLGQLKYKSPDQIFDAVGNLNGADYSGLELFNAGQVRSLAYKGHCVGLHTHSHSILTTLTEQAAINEIERSISVITDAIPGFKSAFMAYPNGTPNKDFSSKHMLMVKEAGFAGAFSSRDGGFSKDAKNTSFMERYKLPRFLPHRKQNWIRALSSLKISGESSWRSEKII